MSSPRSRIDRGSIGECYITGEEWLPLEIKSYTATEQQTWTKEDLVKRTSLGVQAEVKIENGAPNFQDFAHHLLIVFSSQKNNPLDFNNFAASFTYLNFSLFFLNSINVIFIYVS